VIAQRLQAVDCPHDAGSACIDRMVDYYMGTLHCTARTAQCTAQCVRNPNAPRVAHRFGRPLLS